MASTVNDSSAASVPVQIVVNRPSKNSKYLFLRYLEEAADNHNFSLFFTEEMEPRRPSQVHMGLCNLCPQFSNALQAHNLDYSDAAYQKQFRRCLTSTMEQIEEFLQDNQGQTGVPAIASSSSNVIVDPINFHISKYPFLSRLEVEAAKGNFSLYLHPSGQLRQTCEVHENLCAAFPDFKQALDQHGLAFDPANKPYQERFRRVLDKVTGQVTKYIQQHGWKTPNETKGDKETSDTTNGAASNMSNGTGTNESSIVTTNGNVTDVTLPDTHSDFLTQEATMAQVQAVIANLPPTLNGANVSFNFSFNDNRTVHNTNTDNRGTVHNNTVHQHAPVAPGGGSRTGNDTNPRSTDSGQGQDTPTNQEGTTDGGSGVDDNANSNRAILEGVERVERLLTQQGERISTQLKRNADDLTKTVKKMRREERGSFSTPTSSTPSTGSPKTPAPKTPAANLGGMFDQAANQAATEEPSSPPTVEEDQHWFHTLFQQVLLQDDLPDDQKGLVLSLQEAMKRGDYQHPIAICPSVGLEGVAVQNFLDSVFDFPYSQDNKGDEGQEDSNPQAAKVLVLNCDGNPCFISIADNDLDLQDESRVNDCFGPTAAPAFGNPATIALKLELDDEDSSEITIQLDVKESNGASGALVHVLGALKKRFLNGDMVEGCNNKSIKSIQISSPISEGTGEVPFSQSSLSTLTENANITVIFEKIDFTKEQEQLLAQSKSLVEFKQCSFASGGKFVCGSDLGASSANKIGLRIKFNGCYPSMESIQKSFDDGFLEAVEFQNIRFGTKDVAVLQQLHDAGILTIKTTELFLDAEGFYQNGNIVKLLDGDAAMKIRYESAYQKIDADQEKEDVKMDTENITAGVGEMKQHIPLASSTGEPCKNCIKSLGRKGVFCNAHKTLGQQ